MTMKVYTNSDFSVIFTFVTFLADVDEFLLFNNSPKIVGTSLTVDYNISGCAQVLCQVRARIDKIDCEYTSYVCLFC